MLKFVAVFVALLSFAHALYGEDTAVSPTEGFAFLEKFCFQNQDSLDKWSGELTLNLKTADPSKAANIRVYLFDDQDDSWEYIKRVDMTCGKQITHARNWPQVENNDARFVVHWNADNEWSSGAIQLTQRARPRFWYVVIANCEGFAPVEWNVHFLNYAPWWYQEIGVDEWGMNTLYLLFFFVYLGFSSYWIYRIVTLRKAGEPVPTAMRLLIAAIWLQFLSIFFGLIHFGQLTRDGRGVPFFHDGLEFLNSASHVLFVLLLLMLARGWSVTTAELTHKIAIGVMILALTIAWLTVIIWDLVNISPLTTEHVFNLAPGVVLFVFNLIIGAYFTFSSAQTILNENDYHRKLFFATLLSVYTMFFFIVSLLVLTPASVASYAGNKAVSTLFMILMTAAFIVMSYFMSPTNMTYYFPKDFTHVTRDVDPSATRGAHMQIDHSAENVDHADFSAKEQVSLELEPLSPPVRKAFSPKR